MKLTYDGDDESSDLIDEVYSLSYVPEGYVLKRESATNMYVNYKFENQNGDYIKFEQRAITSSDFYIDIEQGYSQINEIENYEIYYRTANDFHWFVWNHREYSIKIKSNIRLSNDEIVQIIQGIKIK